MLRLAVLLQISVSPAQRGNILRLSAQPRQTFVKVAPLESILSRQEVLKVYNAKYVQRDNTKDKLPKLHVRNAPKGNTKTKLAKQRARSVAQENTVMRMLDIWIVWVV
jgi:hypothetical protein